MTEKISEVILDFIRNNFLTWKGFSAVILLEAVLTAPWLWDNFGEGFSVYKLIFFVGVIIITFFIWIYFWIRRYPHKSRDKIGIVIAITTENKEDYTKLRTEFVDSLRKVINENQISKKFDIVELPNPLAKKVIDSASSREALIKTKCQFIFYGSVVNRSHDGKSNLCLSLDGVVIHKPIPSIVSDNLSREFAAIFPRDVNFPQDQELNGFKFTKEWMNIASKYMIAVAAFVSGDFKLAFSLNEYTYRYLQKNNIISIPNIDFLKNKVRQRLIESTAAMIQLNYFLYRKTKKISHLNDTKRYLNLGYELDPQNYSFHMSRAVYFFKVEKDIRKADKEIRACENAPDGIWRYSRAFLRLYRGKIDAAERSYSKAIKEDLPPHILFEIEEFLMDVVEKEPDKCQLWYGIGILNWKVKGDLKLATDAFEKFLKCENTYISSSQKEKVKEYIDVIKDQ
jgi:hypothetical protein